MNATLRHTSSARRILVLANEAARSSVAIEALTTGPARVLGERHLAVPSLRVGERADLVVIDRAASWTVAPDALMTRGRNTPLLGRALPGVVRLTLAGGRVAYRA